MFLRNLTMTMAVFCLLLTNVLGLSVAIYDHWFGPGTHLLTAVAYTVWGTFYFLAVMFLAMLHDVMARPQQKLRAAFWLALLPTAFYFYVLFIIALG